MMNKIRNGFTEDSCLHIPQIIMFTFTIELLISTILFTVGLTITWHFFIMSFIFSVLVVNLCDKKETTWLEILISVAIFIFFSWIAGEFFDCSWDGNAYHKLAVGLLKNHWNPLKSTPSLSITEGAGVESFGNIRWVEAYCKVTWIFASSIYSMTGNIETGKSYTMLAMICAFFLSFYYMKKKKYRTWQCILFSSILMINPIAVQQMFTFYVDGFLHTILFLTVLALVMLSDRETFSVVESASLVAGIMIICGNIKFTGLLFGGLYCIAFYLLDCFKSIRKQNRLSKEVIFESVFYFAILLGTVFWAGATSYVTNYFRHGSITYPLTGKEKIDILTDNSPFYEQNHVKNMLISLFSKVDSFQRSSGKKAVIKIPFTFDGSEVSCIKATDSRISGFGVIFGGLFIVAIIILVIWYMIKQHDNRKIIATLVLLVSVGLMFGIKESWWARFSPYIYLIVVVALFVVLTSESLLVKYVAVLFALLVLFNNCVPLVHFPQMYKESAQIDAYYCKLKSRDEIEICNPDFEGVYYNFKDYGIKYHVNNALVNSNDCNLFRHRNTKWIER
ncbi:hypothetical protein SAMN06296386_103223 [Lachnospiraceae bacterium]|nr:hypothetical protein SAMN06296386_103223 [Lachnospiraceae bacterium]